MPQAIATGRFVSLFTALQPPTGQGPTGNLTGDWTPILGLIDIACTAAPPLPSRLQATQARDMEEIVSKEFQHVLLSGWYPQLEQGLATGWRCTITDSGSNTVTLLMLGAESDSQGTQTRVHVEYVEL